MIRIRQIYSKNYFKSIDFILRTILSITALIIIITQHVLLLCNEDIYPHETRIYRQLQFSLAVNPWSATSLYVLCCMTILLYVHTILLTYMDNFRVHKHAASFFIQDIVMAMLYLIWGIINAIRVFNCYRSYANFVQDKIEEPNRYFFCKLLFCFTHLGPWIGFLIAFVLSASLAGLIFPNIDFRNLPCFHPQNDQSKSSNIHSLY